MTNSIVVKPSGEVSIVCDFLKEDPRAIRGYLTFLQGHTKSERYNFAQWVIQHVLIAPSFSLEAGVAQTATTNMQATAAWTAASEEPKKLSLTAGARLKFVREMALFAAETADFNALDHSLTFPLGREKMVSAMINTLASSSLCGGCKLATLEHLVKSYKPKLFLSVILRSLKDQDFVRACFTSPLLKVDFNFFALSISAACNGILTLATPEFHAGIDAALRLQPTFASNVLGFFSRDPHFHMAPTKIAVLRKLFSDDIEEVLTVLAHSGDARSVEILLDLEDVRLIRVDMNTLVAEGHLDVLRVLLNHPKFRHHFDPKEMEKMMKKRQQEANKFYRKIQESFASGSFIEKIATVAAGTIGSVAIIAQNRAPNTFVDLAQLIVTAAREDSLEVLRLLIAKAKEYNIPIDTFSALNAAIDAQNTENAQELLQVWQSPGFKLYDSIATAVNGDCVGIVFLLLNSPCTKGIPLSAFFGRHMSIPMFKLLMDDPRFEELPTKGLGTILTNNRCAITLLANSPKFRAFTGPQLNELFSPICLEYLDALKTTGRLDEILPQTVYDEMFRHVRQTNAGGIPLVRALSQTPQFALFETSQLIELYKAAVKRKHHPDYLNILIHSPRFEDIDLETLGQELVKITKLVVFKGSDTALCEMNLEQRLDPNRYGDVEYVKEQAPKLRERCQVILKAMIAAPRLRKISPAHIRAFTELAKEIKDQALLEEVAKFLSLIPENPCLEVLRELQGLLKSLRS